jgi:hypothetical protein
MILSSEISDLLNEAEVRFPVDQWDIAGVHAWPLLRIRYGFGMLAKHGYRTTVKNGNGSRAVDVLGGPARRLVARLQDHTQNASLSAPAEVVLLSDGISYAEIGGSWMEKFCDPLITKLEQRHLRCYPRSTLTAYRATRPRISCNQSWTGRRSGHSRLRCLQDDFQRSTPLPLGRRHGGSRGHRQTGCAALVLASAIWLTSFVASWSVAAAH